MICGTVIMTRNHIGGVCYEKGYKRPETKAIYSPP